VSSWIGRLLAEAGGEGEAGEGRGLGALAFPIGITLLAMIFVGVRALWLSAAYHGNVVDDALISMQYARNLAEGNGLVFNPGERVEGYTNFLWTLILAALHLGSSLFDFDAVRAAVLTSIGVACLVVGLVYVLGRSLWGSDRLATFAAVGLVALDSAYAPWAMQALEGHLLLLWIMLSLLVLERRPRYWPIWLGLLLAAVQMTRPDGALFLAAAGLSFAVGLLGKLLTEGFSEQVRSELRGGLGVIGVFALVFGSYFAWKYSYYGYPMPNTYYLKVGGSDFDAWGRGWSYLQSFFAERGWVPVVAVLALRWLREPLVRTLAIYAGIHLVYVAYVGGDFYPGHRFLLVLVPVFSLLVGRVVFGLVEQLRADAAEAAEGDGATTSAERRLPSGRGSTVYLVLGVAVAIALGAVWRIGATKGPAVTEVARAADGVDRTKRFLTWLGERASPGDSIAVGDIGSSGYYGRLHVIDVYGVIDPFVAHMDIPDFGKGKAGHEKRAPTSYVLEKRPTYIKLGYLPGDHHRNGYYLNGEMPLELKVEGLWELDPLLELGRFRPGAGFDFDRPDPRWIADGDAFTQVPAPPNLQGQQRIFGASGGLVNSYHPASGDRAVGTLRSPAFLLDGDLMVLRVGGGHDPEKLRISLLVDGERIHSATGRNSEVLTRRNWDIGPYRGRTATLELVDRASGPWGHLLVDEIQLWDRHPPASAVRD